MGATLRLGVVLALACVAHAQYYNDQTTPIPILKQINRHNEDGSYSYGYEGADGSFKIETKHPTGEVFGKYGYVDDVGKVREIEYGASKRGFEPTGTGINVPPPTLHGNSVSSDGYDDGQYHEDPSVYYKTNQYNGNTHRQTQNSYKTHSAPQYNPPTQQQYNHQAQQHHYSAPAQHHHYSPPAQQHHYSPPAKQHYNPPQESYYNPPQERYYNPPHQQYHGPPAPRAPIDPNLFRGHPASNFNVDTGSYSITYSG